MLQSILTITGNYSKDLAAAKDAAIFPKGAMPKKLDLYAAIELANSELSQVTEICGLAVDEAIESQDLESNDATGSTEDAIGSEIDLDSVAVSKSVRESLNDLFKRSADLAKGSHVIAQNEVFSVTATLEPINIIELVTDAPVITGDPLIDNSIAYANAHSKAAAAELHAQWSEQQEQRRVGKKTTQSVKKEQRVYESWGSIHQVKADEFFASKSRITRSKIISELSIALGSKVVAEQLNLSEQKIKKETRAYDIYNSDELVQKAISDGMSLSHIIDNISSPEKYQAACNAHIEKQRAKRFTVVTVS